MAGRGSRTITYEDFSAGIDLREGLVTRDSRKFLDLINYLTTFGRKLTRRPPFALLGGALHADAQGLLYLNGQFVTIAKSGATLTHTLPFPVTTLYFDNPEYATTWELLDLVTLNEVVVAAVRHAYPGGTVTSRILLHVWDDKRPTWVDDPAVPTSWTPSFPLHAYGNGTAGSFKDYTPALKVVADKLHMTGPDGNTAFSGVNKPRVWSDRDANDILDNGRSWYFITPDSGTTFTFTVPIPYADLTQPQKYAAYVCERMFDNGIWHQFREVASLIQSGDYTVSPVTNRFGLSFPEVRLTMLWSGGPGRIIRFRALARPAVTITAGCVLTPSGAISGGSLDVEGASYDIDPVNVSDSVTTVVNTTYNVIVPAPGAPIPLVSAYVGGVGAMPLNGQQRYWSRIIAVATTDAVVPTSFAFDYTGTASVTLGQTNVDGVATAFLTQAIPGEQIMVAGQIRTIRTVISDTRIDCSQQWTITEAGVIPLRDIRYDYAHEVGDSGNLWFAARETEAAFDLAGADNAGVLNTSLYDPSGAVPIALGAAQNRLLVQFPETIQLWGVQPDPSLNAHLATDGTGAGHNTRPTAALIDGYVVLPTHAGPRMFSPDGQNKDYIKQVEIGDLVRSRIASENLRFAVWWPRMRLYITAQQEADDLTLWAHAYHPNDKTAAWSRFVVTGLTRIDGMFIAQDDLYILSDHRVWRVDPDATLFRDSTDTLGSPYLSTARWLYNDFGLPSQNKKLLTFDIGQTGKSSVALFTAPSDYNADAPTLGPTVSGYTQGRQRVPLGLLSPAVSLQITSQDEAGHTLDFVGFTYVTASR